MDERLEKALEFSNFMVTFNNQKRVLKEKYSQDLIYYHVGAQFTVTKELINFCYTLLSSDNTEAIILDDNDLPVQISNLQEFHTNILDIYFTASNEYFNKYVALKKHRSVQGLVEINV
jgi:hypothetical protein